MHRQTNNKALELAQAAIKEIGDSRDKRAFDKAHEIFDLYIMEEESDLWDMSDSLAATRAGQRFLEVEGAKDLLGFIDDSKFC